jgi:hypothetical protein
MKPTAKAKYDHIKWLVDDLQSNNITTVLASEMDRYDAMGKKSYAGIFIRAYRKDNTPYTILMKKELVGTKKKEYIVILSCDAIREKEHVHMEYNIINNPEAADYKMFKNFLTVLEDYIKHPLADYDKANILTY